MADDDGSHPADCGERVRGCYSPPRVLWMKLRDGVQPRNLITFYFAVFMSTHQLMLTFPREFLLTRTSPTHKSPSAHSCSDRVVHVRQPRD